jgi:hypothetical protein
MTVVSVGEASEQMTGSVVTADSCFAMLAHALLTHKTEEAI